MGALLSELLKVKKLLVGQKVKGWTFEAHSEQNKIPCWLGDKSQSDSFKKHYHCMLQKQRNSFLRDLSHQYSADKKYASRAERTRQCPGSPNEAQLTPNQLEPARTRILTQNRVNPSTA